MTAIEILEQARLDIAKKYGYSDWTKMYNRSCEHFMDECSEEASLLAMERIAEMSWDKGKQATIDNAHKFSDTYVISGKINEDKSTYINNHFPKL